MRLDSNKPWRAWDRERHPGVGLLRNLIGSDVSRPCFVVPTTLVLQLLLNFSTILDNQTGNLCRIIISSNQPWSTKSYIFLTSIHAKLRLLFRRWQSKVTVLSISKLSIVLLHPARAPLLAPSIKPCVSRCSFAGPNRHDLYKVFKQVIGLSLSMVNSPGFGSSMVLPSENQAEYSMLVLAMVWNDIATPSWSTFAFFHQKLVNLSGPRALQFFFLASTFVGDGGGTRL